MGNESSESNRVNIVIAISLCIHVATIAYFANEQHSCEPCICKSRSIVGSFGAVGGNDVIRSSMLSTASLQAQYVTASSFQSTSLDCDVLRSRETLFAPIVETDILVVSGKLPDLEVQALTATSIRAEKLTASSISTSHVELTGTSPSLTTASISAGSFSAQSLTSSTLSATQMSIGALTATSLTAQTVQAATLSAGQLTVADGFDITVDTWDGAKVYSRDIYVDNVYCSNVVSSAFPNYGQLPIIRCQIPATQNITTTKITNPKMNAHTYLINMWTTKPWDPSYDPLERFNISTDGTYIRFAVPGYYVIGYSVTAGAQALTSWLTFQSSNGLESAYSYALAGCTASGSVVMFINADNVSNGVAVAVSVDAIEADVASPMISEFFAYMINSPY